MINLIVDLTSAREKLGTMLMHCGKMIFGNLVSIGEQVPSMYSCVGLENSSRPHLIGFIFIGNSLSHVHVPQ